MISVKLIGRLGNHLWQYAVCRTIAEKRGYLFHIPRDFLGSDLFDCTLGIEKDLTYKEHYDAFMCSSMTAQFFNPNIFNIKDFTRLVGFFQTERYIADNKSNIQNWFSLKNVNKNLLSELNLDGEVCLINFRGGDYKTFSDHFLGESYWRYAVAEMIKINKNMRFVVITDDVTEAQIFFPGYPVYHFSVADDFCVISHAKYLIIANSTFSWWAAWLNKRSLITIAPKYWFKFNSSSGWWAPAESITKGFQYIDKQGHLTNSTQCIDEFNGQGFSYSSYPY
jgi:hypothetical protein